MAGAEILMRDNGWEEGKKGRLNVKKRGETWVQTDGMKWNAAF